MTQTASLVPSVNGHHEVHIEGHFQHPHWVAFLFTGLAAQEISVVSGRALQNALHGWNAHFKLNFDRSTASPAALDYVALAQQAPNIADLEQPRLSTFKITQKPTGLEVQLVGPDQIGFLSRILRRISLLALFPIDIEIDTVAGSIKDRIVFSSIGGANVSETIVSSLETLLGDLIVP